MEKAYQNLDIQFLPDNIITQLNQEKFAAELSLVSNSFMSHLSNSISTEILSQNTFIQADMFSVSDQFQNLFWTHIEKLI